MTKDYKAKKYMKKSNLLEKQLDPNINGGNI